MDLAKCKGATRTCAWLAIGKSPYPSRLEISRPGYARPPASREIALQKELFLNRSAIARPRQTCARKDVLEDLAPSGLVGKLRVGSMGANPTRHPWP
jgi:hypothetical protein